MRPADYRFYPMDFPSPLETDSATGGTIAYVDWQKGRKNFWKTGKKAVQKNRKHLQTRRILLYNYFKNRGAISPKKRKIFRRKK